MTDSTIDSASPETVEPAVAGPTEPAHAAGAAKRYQRWRVVLSVSEWLAVVLLLVAMIRFGWSVEIRDFAERYSRNAWLVIAIYLLPVGLLFGVLSMVFSALRTFVLDRRFAMSRQGVDTWLADEIKGLLIGGALMLLAVETFYALIRRFPDTWWLWAGVTFALLLVGIAYLAPVLLFPLFFKFTPVTDDEIAGRLQRLAGRAGTRVRCVYEFNLSRKTRAANAALVGFGRTRRIVLADTLLDNFTLGEIEIVLAHEFGHHALRHLPKAVGIQTVSLFVFFACLGWVLGGSYQAWGVWGFRGSTDVANLPLVLLVVTMLGMATLPITNGLLRRFERQADAYALESASEPEAFCSAFQRVAQLNLADSTPNPLIEFIFHSHPSIGRRISRAEAFLRQRGRLRLENVS